MSLSRNEKLDPIVDNCEKVSHKGKSMTISGFDLNNLLTKAEEKRDRFFTYKGSLPFPPCDPGVEWTVMAAPSKVGEIQVFILALKRLASLFDTLSVCLSVLLSVTLS